MKPTIAIIGLGCLGTLVAYHLRQFQPQFFPRPSFQSGGKTRSTAQSAITRTVLTPDNKASVQAELTLAPVENQAIDWLIVCTKAADTEAVMQQVIAFSQPIKRLLLLQNGMGQQAMVTKIIASHRHLSHLSECQLWAGISTEGAFKSGENKIVYAGKGEYIIGPWPTAEEEHNKNSSSLPAPFQFDGQIIHRLRQKLAVNAVINPLTAHYRCLNGELISQPHYHQQTIALCQEVEQTFAKLQWSGAEDLTDRVISIAQSTALNRSSTLQDVERKLTTELNFISGYITSYAKQNDISTPLQSDLLKALADQGVNY